jgi:hemerythrin-like domain-containing protein
MTARYDIYTNIHHAMRACMGDTLAVVGRIDVNDRDDLLAGLQQLHELLHLCDSHIAKETHFVHVAMERRRPGSSARITDQHVEHAELLQTLRELADRLGSAGDAGGRAAAKQRLYAQLALFVADNFEHMHVEDTEHNAVLWAAFSDEELQQIEGAIIASIPPEDMAVIFRWMLPAIDHPARVALLEGVRQGAPREVFEGVLAIAQARLGRRDWQKLTAALQLVQAA